MEKAQRKYWSVRLKHPNYMLRFKSAFLTKRKHNTFCVILGNWRLGKGPQRWACIITKTGDFSPFFGIILESQAINNKFQLRYPTTEQRYLVSSTGMAFLNGKTTYIGWRLKRGDRLETIYENGKIQWRINGVKLVNADVKEPPKGDYYRACLAHCRSISNPELITVVQIQD